MPSFLASSRCLFDEYVSDLRFDEVETNQSQLQIFSGMV